MAREHTKIPTTLPHQSGNSLRNSKKLQFAEITLRTEVTCLVVVADIKSPRLRTLSEIQHKMAVIQLFSVKE